MKFHRLALTLFLTCTVVAVFLLHMLFNRRTCVHICNVDEDNYEKPMTWSLMDQVGEIPLVHSRLHRCKGERINMVFIKTHKTGSDTVTNILHRFGFRRNLTFVVPTKNRMSFCWPYLIQENRCFRPLKTNKFNIMSQHVVYTPNVIARIMPPDTVYLTSIRKPFPRFKSAFNYFHLHTRANLKNLTLEDYLTDVQRMETEIKSPGIYDYKHQMCVPPGYSYTFNGMAFDLGFHTGFHRNTVDQTHNATFIRKWITTLSRQFSLVLVLEYFHESLVLLRRLMCWTTEDILYIKLNARKYGYKEKEFDPRLVANYKRYNVPEYVLYDHFNRTLWFMIATAGKDFWAEVRHLDDVINSVSRFCDSTNATSLIPASPWNKNIILRRQHCNDMTSILENRMAKRYEAQPGKIKNNKRSAIGC